MKTASLIVDVILKLSAFFVVGVFGDGVNTVQFTKFASLKCKKMAVCATSPPAISFPVQSQGQCMLEGQSKRYLPQTFVGVNYREQNKVCEMFSANPTSFAYNVQGCQYMQKDVSTSVQCADIDECQTNNGGCSPDATCSNNQGSFTCTCKVGFARNGTQCSDVNECLVNNGGCNANAVCNNTRGSFNCTCKNGYSGNGTSCADINECQTNNGGCSPDATCTNTPGSFTCICKVGFIGNGTHCSVQPQCVQGTTLEPKSASGTITSMNYPAYYINSADCAFRITASSPYTVVRLTFTAFCTEPGPDYVKVYDGPSASSPELQHFTGCVGYSPWNGMPGIVTTTQRYMYVRFIADGAGLLSGFSATYNMQ